MLAALALFTGVARASAPPATSMTTWMDGLPAHWALTAVLLIGVSGVCISRLYALRARLRKMQADLSAHHFALEGVELDYRKANAELHAAYTVLSDKEAFLSQLTDTALDGIFALDQRGTVVFANEAAEAILGYGRNALHGLNIHDRVLAHERAGGDISDDAVFERGSEGAVIAKTLRLDALRRDGSRVPVEISVSALQHEGAWHTVGVMRDISERLAMETALAETRRNFRSLVQENKTGILILDAEGTILFGNPAASRLLSSHEEQLVGSPFGIPSVSNLQTELNVIRADGSPGIAAVSVTETRWEDQLAYLVMLYDITERKQAERRVHQLAFEDSLTGLPNRSLFFNRLQEAVKRTRRDQHGFALMFLDLDGFKGVNDSLGHAVGDDLLRAVARRLTSAIRESDTVARMGGDEFTIILPGVVAPRAAADVAKKILALFKHPFEIDGRELVTSTSIGLSICPTHSQDPQELLRQADSAMYDAKRHGSNGFRLYHSDMTLTVDSRLRLEQELRGALLREEVVLFFQPQFDLGSGARVAVEALLRWQHPERGLLPPERFLPMLDGSALIAELGRQRLTLACRQLRRCQDDCPDRVPVAVNISPMQIESSDLVSDVKTALRSSGIDPRWLILEISETALIANMMRSTESLQALVDLGVQLHIDNFGTGYTSLDLLRMLPISAVKIDRAFVAGLDGKRAERALIEGTIAVAHGLEKLVVAEGIDTHEQHQLLRELGCDRGQGDLLGPPVPAEDLCICQGKDRPSPRTISATDA